MVLDHQTICWLIDMLIAMFGDPFYKDNTSSVLLPVASIETSTKNKFGILNSVTLLITL